MAFPPETITIGAHRAMLKAGLPFRLLAAKRAPRAARRANPGKAKRAVSPLAFVTIAALAACTSMPAPNSERAPTASPAQAAPAIGNFSAGLRCMDTLLLDYGARDLTVIVEDLADPTQRSGAGAKDLLIAAVSDMTQRSRAIRLVASGKDWGNTANYLSQALKRDPFAVVPQYALRGSIGMQDGAAGSSAALLNLDLTLLSTRDMSVVPGLSARNQAVLFRTGNALSGKAELSKFGIRYELAPGGGDGFARALRAVIEVGAIELVGRLARVPYWTCLGATDANPAVAAEIQDWYDSMAARPSDIIGFFQGQLRLRRIYDGPIDGTVNGELKEAVARYREALGLSREPKVSLDFFKAYLGADHHRFEAQLAPAPAAAGNASAQPVSLPAPPLPAPPVAPSVSTAPLTLRIAAANDARRFARGSAVQLTIRPSRDAHVYCFLQDEHHKIMRFFPNRFQSDSRVQPDRGLQLPGAMRFEIVMNARGAQQTVACFATDHDVLAQLPAPLTAGDFETLPVASLEQVRGAFASVTGGALAQQSFQLQAK